MALQISSLRRWFAVAAVVVVALVAGTYFYARHRVQNALKQVPEKIGLDIQQTANGFSVSKSEQGRTLFRLNASKAVQFKQGGHTELHDVQITMYGRDSDRFDQISGSDFEYDPKSGAVVANGEVRIDLESNPKGATDPDQSAPKDQANAIHLKTKGLVFNQKTGDASTKERVEFQLPQASGSAMGVSYVAKTNTLTLGSQIQMVFSGATPATVMASHGAIYKNPDTVVLENPHVLNGSRKSQADKATIFLRSDNTIARVLAEGDVDISSEEQSHLRAEQLEILLDNNNQLQTALFAGNVQFNDSRGQPVEGSAGRVIVSFNADNAPVKAHAEDNVKLAQHPGTTGNANQQDMELTAPAVDVLLADGRRIQSAETSPGAQITLRPADQKTGEQTLVTADKFQAGFDAAGQLTSLHGAPNARIVNQNPNQPDRVSTSEMLDVMFHPGSGVEYISQRGNVAYHDGERTAFSEQARYTPTDQVLVLNGSPRVSDRGMATTARVIRFNRQSGEVFADGDVKSTYSDLKPQPNGALLASSSPIHVTSRTMTAHQTSATALYSGNARLWQDANTVVASSIEFDRDRRSMVAHGSKAQPVSTVLEQTGSDGKTIPVEITSGKLSYTDAERKAEFTEGVMATASDLSITSHQMDAFLEAHGQTDTNSPSAVGKLDRIVANGEVVVTQPQRHANGDRLVYTAADDKFVLTGGPPSIFDAEHGKVTGVSLTLYRRDDRVLVKGDSTDPAVTQTRVAR